MLEPFMEHGHRRRLQFGCLHTVCDVLIMTGDLRTSRCDQHGEQGGEGQIPRPAAMLRPSGGCHTPTLDQGAAHMDARNVDDRQTRKEANASEFYTYIRLLWSNMLP